MRAIDADALQLAIVEEGQANKRKKYIIGDIWELTGAEIREVIDSQPTINPEPNWIPVTERLPQTGESVMICDAYGDICIGHRTMGGYYFPDFCEDKIKDVRAWCELPEPFKEVTE
jgi:hypothetical protein